MKQKYETPTLNVTPLNLEDVIRTSGQSGEIKLDDIKVNTDRDF